MRGLEEGIKSSEIRLKPGPPPPMNQTDDRPVQGHRSGVRGAPVPEGWVRRRRRNLRGGRPRLHRLDEAGRLINPGVRNVAILLGAIAGYFLGCSVRDKKAAVLELHQAQHAQKLAPRPAPPSRRRPRRPSLRRRSRPYPLRLRPLRPPRLLRRLLLQRPLLRRLLLRPWSRPRTSRPRLRDRPSRPHPHRSRLLLPYSSPSLRPH